MSKFEKGPILENSKAKEEESLSINWDFTKEILGAMIPDNWLLVFNTLFELTSVCSENKFGNHV